MKTKITLTEADKVRTETCWSIVRGKSSVSCLFDDINGVKHVETDNALSVQKVQFVDGNSVDTALNIPVSKKPAKEVVKTNTVHDTLPSTSRNTHAKKSVVKTVMKKTNVEKISKNIRKETQGRAI